MSELHRFLFEDLAVRGAIVRLDDEWQSLQLRRGEGRALPAPVNALLGEMAAAALLMHSSIKFDGSLILQIQGDGPVKLAVAEANPIDDTGALGATSFRCTAQVRGEVGSQACLSEMVNVLNEGRCVITLDPKGRSPGQQPYQGIVPLFGDRREKLESLSAVLSHYMLQSEQLETSMALAADGQVATGILVQRMPRQGAANLGELAGETAKSHADFEHVAALLASLGQAELLAQPPLEVLHRLFWNEKLLRHPPTPTRFACTCSRDRVAGMLRGLGEREVNSILAERGVVEVTCEFCGAEYRFDPIDSRAALAGPLGPNSGGSLH